MLDNPKILPKLKSKIIPAKKAQNAPFLESLIIESAIENNKTKLIGKKAAWIKEKIKIIIKYQNCFIV